jgi:hypothetical protein
MTTQRLPPAPFYVKAESAFHVVIVRSLWSEKQVVFSPVSAGRFEDWRRAPQLKPICFSPQPEAAALGFRLSLAGSGLTP